MKQFDKAIAVLRAAQMILETKVEQADSRFEKFMLASQISGLDLAMKLLDEVNE